MVARPSYGNQLAVRSCVSGSRVAFELLPTRGVGFLRLHHDEIPQRPDDSFACEFIGCGIRLGG